MSWAVLCDFDRTISTVDATDLLLERHALPEWLHIEEMWKQGQIGSRDCMRRQIALVRATPPEVDALADTIAIDPHFKSFAMLCAQNRIPLIVVSDGLDYVIRRILHREGLEHLHVIASHMSHTQGNEWQLAAPFSDPGCLSQNSTCKCAISRQMRELVKADKIFYVGDGRSDYCVSMEEADVIFAKDSLLTYCQQHQLPYHPFNHFAEVSQYLETLIQSSEFPLAAHTEEANYV